jgi:hypothetical protein
MRVSRSVITSYRFQISFTPRRVKYDRMKIGPERTILDVTVQYWTAKMDPTAHNWTSGFIFLGRRTEAREKMIATRETIGAGGALFADACDPKGSRQEKLMLFGGTPDGCIALGGTSAT